MTNNKIHVPHKLALTALEATKYSNNGQSKYIQKILESGIINLSDIVTPSFEEEIMKEALKQIHKYKISRSGDRYVTYVPDEAKKESRYEKAQRKKFTNTFLIFTT